MKNIVNSYQNSFEFIQEFRQLNSNIWSHIWIHIMDSSMNSGLWRISWIHGWVPINEFTYEIMIEFIKLKLIWIPLQICFSELEWRNKFYSSKRFQSDNDQFVAVNSLAALRMLSCCCLMATGLRCCDGRRRVLQRTAELGGLEGLDGRRWTSLASRSAWPACQLWRKL